MVVNGDACAARAGDDEPPVQRGEIHPPGGQVRVTAEAAAGVGGRVRH